MVFGGTAARSSAIGTANFEEGMLTYLTDVDKLQVYTGASFVDVYPAAATNQGLTLINTTSFSAVSSQSFNTVFSSTYDNYKLVCKITSSATIADLSLRLRATTTDNSSANYWFSSSLTTAGATTYIVTSGTSTASTSFRLSPAGSTYQSKHVIDILNPFSTDQTGYLADAFFWSGTSDYGRTVNGGVMTVTTSYDGFTLIPSTGTITGTVSIYGYNK
jgi:hypothetical protein